MAGYAWQKRELDLIWNHAIEQGNLITKEWADQHLPTRNIMAVRTMKQRLSGVSSVDAYLASISTEKVLQKPKQPHSASRSLPELLQDMASAYERKALRSEQKNDLSIMLEDDLPYILAFFGDPHVGDNGCDIERLAYCMAWASQTPRVHAINIGDLSNNWIGALQRLYAHQSTTDDEETELVEWLLDSCPWSLVILGNHDKWGPIASLLCKARKITYAAHGGVLKLFSPSCQPVIVDVRHTHRGNSQYNPSFAQAKMSFRGSPADIIAGGHTHNGAVTILRNGVTQKVSTCIRVGSFKRHDEFADSKGFLSEDLGPLALCVIDPREEDTDRVTVFHSTEKAERYLKSLLADADDIAA